MVLYSLLFCVLAALADIVGGSITLFRKLDQQHLRMITAIGSGFLLGATLLDRFPDAFHELPTFAPVCIIIGYLFMLMMDTYITGHDHVEQSPSHTHVLEHRTGVVAYLGMLLHTFMDGVVIAGAFAINPGTGFLMFLAITMHKLPEGFSMATLLLTAGNTHTKAFRSTVGLAISTILGGVVSIWIGAVDSLLIKLVMAFAAGSFLFITTSSLIPIVKASKNKKDLLALVASVVFFYLSMQLIQNVGLS